MRQTLDETISDGIWILRHDNWNHRRQLLGGAGIRGTPGHDDVYLRPHQLGGISVDLIGPAFRKAPVDRDIPPVDISQVAESLEESISVVLPITARR